MLNMPSRYKMASTTFWNSFIFLDIVVSTQMSLKFLAMLAWRPTGDRTLSDAKFTDVSCSHNEFRRHSGYTERDVMPWGRLQHCWALCVCVVCVCVFFGGDLVFTNINNAFRALVMFSVLLACARYWITSRVAGDMKRRGPHVMWRHSDDIACQQSDIYIHT